MKIEAEIQRVEAREKRDGSVLAVTAVGGIDGIYGRLDIELEMTSTETTRQAYYVGRRIDIEVTPR